MEGLTTIKQRFEIIGNDPKLNRSLEKAMRVAPTDISVLVTGESGVGKETIPKIIHQLSHRKHANYIAVNCGAIPEGTIDSELFGHEKGAFTGAVDKRIGRFEQANGGTLFLDEIGDMPLDSQTRLLRVLSNKEFYRVGGDKPIKVDVRIIAATHQNLNNLVSQKSFREDLFYRLNVIKIDVPPLRDRKEDIGALTKYFLKNHSDSLDEELRVLSPEVMDVIANYNWPGNVRQLENICYWLALMTPTQNVKIQDLPSEIKDHEAEEPISDSWEDRFNSWIKNIASSVDKDLMGIANKKLDKIIIRAALDKTNGRKNEAAILLGLGRNTLSKKMKDLGI
jgi:two-component system nitrogen regulation response regulator GlnG